MCLSVGLVFLFLLTLAAVCGLNVPATAAPWHNLMCRRGRGVMLQRYLSYPALVASALESGLEKFVKDGFGSLVVNETAGQNEHIGIVMLADEVGYLGYPRQSGTYSLMLVERHADAFAASADANAGIYFAAFDPFGQRMAEIGVVTAKVTIRTIVLVGVAVAFKILQHKLFEGKARMVAGYSHCLYVHSIASFETLLGQKSLHLLIYVLASVAQFLVKHLIRS